MNLHVLKLLYLSTAGLLALTCYEQSGTLPSVPLNPSPVAGATRVGLTTTLSWRASDTATSYDIYVGTSAAPDLAATVTNTSYVARYLHPDTKHYWKVVAKNSIGSTPSPIWSFTTLAWGQLSCDLNSDGVVNVLDVQIAVGQATGKAPCGSADLNQDGFCNAVDVQRVVNASLGRGCRIGF